MGPQRSRDSDRASETVRPPLGRPPSSRVDMLAAARTVFDSAASPQAVTMDAVAAAAGVGKGTVFRAFGDRDGLLDALVGAEFAALRSAVDEGQVPFAEGAPASRKIGAFLDAVLDFKLANRNLMRAREIASTTNNLASERYRWMHDVVQQWVEQAGNVDSMSPSYVAHVLLLPLQMDVLDELLDEGAGVDELRRQQTHYREALLTQDAPGMNLRASAGPART